MKLSGFIIKTTIIKNLKATDKKGALEELVNAIKKAYRLPTLKTNATMDELLKREKIGSTGIGNGIGVPHAKIKNLTNVLGAFGRSDTGIDFDALDGEPVHLIFLILAPTDQPESNLQALQRVSQAIKQPNFCRFLKEAREEKSIIELFREVDTVLDKDHVRGM
jgi:nitrogen PTS system EIIA component